MIKMLYVDKNNSQNIGHITRTQYSGLVVDK